MPRRSKNNSVTKNFQNISITLDKPCFYAGEVINGNVSFELTNRIHTSNLKLKVHGYAKIRSNNNGSVRRAHKKLENDFKAQENIIENEVVLTSRTGDKSYMYLESGRHSYSFQIPLTNSLPSSYEHPYGKICYKVKFETGEGGTQKILFEKPFTVLGILDLNNFRYLKQPNSVKLDKNMKKCGCRKSGIVSVTLNTLQGAYVPGQSIPFGLVIKNDSTKNIRKLFVYLLQETHIQATSSLRVVSKFEFPKKILKNTTEVYKNGLLNIPPVCQTFNHNLIRVNYFLLVSFKKIREKVKRIKNDTLTIPITIGNRPFREDQATFRHITFKQCIFGNNLKAKNINTVSKRNEHADYRPNYIFYE